MIEEVNNYDSGGNKVKQGAVCVIKNISKDLFYLTQEKESARRKIKGHIGLVGGRQEPGENIINLIQRELAEEGGLVDIHENNLRNIGNLTLNDINQIHPQIDVAVFGLEVPDIELISNDEIQGLLLTKKEIGELIKENPRLVRPLVLESLYYWIPGTSKQVKSVIISNGNYNSLDDNLVRQILQYYQ